MKRKAVFLDRDGTLIEERGYLRDPAGVRLLPGVAESLALLKTHDFLLILVTNQSGVARGLMTDADVCNVNQALSRALPAAAQLDAIYVCPHGPEDGCSCRKPLPGLLLRAIDAHALAPEQSWIVGDKLADLAAGRALGVRGILVRTGHGEAQSQHADPQDVIAPDLPSAVRLLLNREETKA